MPLWLLKMKFLFLTTLTYISRVTSEETLSDDCEWVRTYGVRQYNEGDIYSVTTVIRNKQR
jgi:hypothetical protein